MKKIIAIILITLLVVSVYLFLSLCNSEQADTLMVEFTEYLKQEARKQGVTAEYLLESGQITFEQWQDENRNSK